MKIIQKQFFLLLISLFLFLSGLGNVFAAAPKTIPPYLNCSAGSSSISCSWGSVSGAT